MTKGPALALLMLLCCAAALPAAARDIAVGNVAAIVTALQQVQPGDTITIAPGRYELPAIRLQHGGTKDHPITLRARQLGTVELSSGASELFKVAASDWVFENLDISGTCPTDADCEHAFHIVGAADRTIIRHNRIRDYNAHIEGDGDGGRFPNDVLIEDNWLFGTHARHTDRPVAPIDVVGGKGWIVRDNLIADYGKTFDHAATRADDFSDALSFKGNTSGALIERNVVLCADRLPRLPFTRGLSLADTGTGRASRDSVIRNNVVLACAGQPAIYLSRATGVQVTGNTLIATGGVVATGAETAARVTNNAIAGGGVIAQGGAHLDLGQRFRIGGNTDTAPPEFAQKRIAAYRAYWDALTKDSGGSR